MLWRGLYTWKECTDHLAMFGFKELSKKNLVIMSNIAKWSMHFLQVYNPFHISPPSGMSHFEFLQCSYIIITNRSFSNFCALSPLSVSQKRDIRFQIYKFPGFCWKLKKLVLESLVWSQSFASIGCNQD